MGVKAETGKDLSHRLTAFVGIQRQGSSFLSEVSMDSDITGLLSATPFLVPRILC